MKYLQLTMKAERWTTLEDCRFARNCQIYTWASALSHLIKSTARFYELLVVEHITS